tara:strand:- start:669 stop:1130 length:462 start_codon:yes stop_codon:yes gene_type:complete
MEQITKKQFKWDLERLKYLLSNTPLLKWVGKYSADNIQEKIPFKDKYNLSFRDTSIAIADPSNVTMLLTNTKQEGSFSSFSLDYLNQIIKVCGTDGTLRIMEDGIGVINFPEANNVVVLAPRIDDGEITTKEEDEAIDNEIEDKKIKESEKNG